MGKKIKKREFDQKLKELLKEDSLIRNVVEHCGGYEEAPNYIKRQIDEKLGIKRKTIMVRAE